MCQSKPVGGLGFSKMEDMNNALLSKLRWQLLSKEKKLGVSILTAKHCDHSSFPEVRNKILDSAIWKGILYTRDLFLGGACKKDGDGSSTDIWKDPWLLILSLTKFLIHKLTLPLFIRFVSYLAVSHIECQSPSIVFLAPCGSIVKNDTYCCC